MQFQLPFGIDGQLGLELMEAVTCVSGEVGEEVVANKIRTSCSPYSTALGFNIGVSFDM
jgi:hypothetical protein